MSEHKVKVSFEQSAYIKMTTLILCFKTEVAWHGVVDRISEREFLVKDIIVHPQFVTNITTNSDQDAYQKWLLELDDNTFNHLKMQGHSHVNMSTVPSYDDELHQSRIQSQMDDDSYYIFMIFNKNLRRNIRVFCGKDVVYQNDDVIIDVIGFDIADFIKRAEKSVVTEKPQFSCYKRNSITNYKKSDIAKGSKINDKNRKKKRRR